MNERRKIGRTRALKLARRALLLKPSDYKVRAERSRGGACCIVVRARAKNPNHAGTEVGRFYGATWRSVAEQMSRIAAKSEVEASR